MVFHPRYSLQVIKRNWIIIWANDSIELSVRFHPTLSGWKNKKSKLIETWVETEGVLSLDIVSQKNKKQKNLINLLQFSTNTMPFFFLN